MIVSLICPRERIGRSFLHPTLTQFELPQRTFPQIESFGLLMDLPLKLRNFNLLNLTFPQHGTEDAIFFTLRIKLGLILVKVHERILF